MLSGRNINQTSDFLFSFKTKMCILISSSVFKIQFSPVQCHFVFQLVELEINFICVGSMLLALRVFKVKPRLYDHVFVSSMALRISNLHGEIFQANW